MLLVIDVGNTNIVVGLYDGAELVTTFRLRTVASRTSDETGILLLELFRGAGIDLRLHGAIVSCVVPDQQDVVVAACRRWLAVDPMVVGPGVRTGMPILADNPREVGADRIVNGVAAFHLVGGPCIVVDFGTATTFDCISARGEYMGGVIAPGFRISADALFTRASKLPRVELVKPKKVIGRNTVHSMQSGLFYGYVAQVDGVVERVAAEMAGEGGHAAVIATGGLATVLAGDSRSIERVEPDLTLLGLRLLFERNAP